MARVSRKILYSDLWPLPFPYPRIEAKQDFGNWLKKGEVWMVGASDYKGRGCGMVRYFYLQRESDGAVLNRGFAHGFISKMFQKPKQP